MGNIDFSLDKTFSAYVVALVVAGVLSLVLAALMKNQKASERFWVGLVGAGFLGYGVYLGWIFDGGTYRLFWYAFILPVFLIFNLFKPDRDEVAPEAAATPAASAPEGDAPAPEQADQD